ncbi:MAG: hypothetical protein SVR94_11465 [Pseudomonadota bacterium]|nr:hypothetical protein [Pseudomonadota bacterium]
MPCNVYAKNKSIGRHFAHPTWLTGNRQQATEIARSVMDVVRWWP